MRSRWTVVAVTVAAGVGLVGCGQAATPLRAGTDPGVTAAQVYEDLVTRVYGSPEDRASATGKATARIQAAIRACMAGKGFDYAPVPDDSVPTPVVPADLTGFAPLQVSFGLAARKQRVAEVTGGFHNPGYESLTDPADQNAYGAAVSACSRAGAGFEESHHPAGLETVSTPLEALLQQVNDGPEVQALMPAYRQCLSTAGHPATDWLDLYLKADAVFPVNGPTWTTLQTDPQWTAAVAGEQAAANADAGCRTVMRDTAVTTARPVLEQFTVDHADELDILDEQWAAIRAAAPVSD